jgi:formylglycine-generating enzyme required for sulfatase activity
MDAFYGPTELERQQTNARQAEIAVHLATGLTRTEAEERLGSQPAFVDLYGEFPVAGVGIAAFEFLDVTGFRLPSEAQWEYACRAGVRAPRYGPIEEIVHLDGEIHAVGKMQSNGFGFYDMLGNAAELCRDRFGGGDYMDRMDGVVDPDDRLSKENPEPRGSQTTTPSPVYSWSRRDQEMHEARMEAEGRKRGMSGAEYEAKSRKWSEQQSVCRVVRGGLKTLESQRASWRVWGGLCLLGTDDYFKDRNRLGLRVARSVEELSIDGDTIMLRTLESE